MMETFTSSSHPVGGAGGGGNGGSRRRNGNGNGMVTSSVAYHCGGGPVVAMMALALVLLLLCTTWATVIVYHNNNNHHDGAASVPSLMTGETTHPPRLLQTQPQHQHQRQRGGGSNRKLAVETAPSSTTAIKTAEMTTKHAEAEAKAMLARRAKDRRERTRPPPVPQQSPKSDAPPLLDDGISFHLPSYDGPPTLEGDDGKKKRAVVTKGNPNTAPALLCGEYARYASVRHPRHYLTDDALNSTSRVLINGIVSNPMGVHLAHALHRQCNVSQIVGVDPMLPNTLRNRMELIDGPLAVLARDVPGFTLALPLSFVGVRSREDIITDDVASSWDDERIRTLMRSNGEDADWDVFDELDPTHVVHLASYRGDVIMERGRAELGNVDGRSPYGDRPMFYRWRQGLVSMEQLLRYLHLSATTRGGTTTTMRRRRRSPHFTYASSDRVYGDAPFSSEGERSRKGRRRRRLASTAGNVVVDAEKKAPKKEKKKKEEARKGEGGDEEKKKRDEAKKKQKDDTDAGARKRAGGHTLEFVEEGQTLHDPPTSLYGASALSDEILASAYAALRGVDSVGLRLSSVYGPYATPGTDVHDMARRAVHSDDVPILPPIPVDDDDANRGTTGTDALVDLLYVDDAVDAIIAAMQFRPPPQPHAADSSSSVVATTATASIFNVGSGGGSLASLREVAVAMEGSFPRSTEEARVENRIEKIPDDSSKRSRVVAVSSVDRAKEYLGLFETVPSGEGKGTEEKTKTTTPLEVGLTKTVLWHHHRDRPDGAPLEKPSATSGGKEKKSDLGPDLSLAANKAVDPASIPCASECSVVSGAAGEEKGATCGSSPYDDVLEVVRNLTASCKYVMYTVNLDPNVSDLHGSEVSTDESKEAKVCKLAFLSRRSILVSKLAEVDVNASKNEGADKGKKKTNKKKESPTEEYFAENNSRVKHRAWTVVWLGDDAVGSPRDTATTIKIAPGSLFGPNVQKAMYVSPTKDRIPPTSAFLTIIQSADFGGKPPKKKWVGVPPYRRKIIYPPQEPRRVVMFLPEPIASGLDDDDPSSASAPPGVGMSTMAYMLSDIDMAAAEPPALARQRSLYDMVPGVLNDEDLRSGGDAGRRGVRYQRTFTQWIIHDLTLEESRRLRCDWYREYRFWHGGGGGGNDGGGDAGQPEFTAEDMSLTYVLARRAAQGRHSDKCDQWISVLDADKRSKSKSTADEYWYLDYGGDKCREYGNHVRDGDGKRIFVRLIEKDVTLFLQKRLGDMKGIFDETNAAGDVKYGDDVNEEEEAIIGKNEDDEESDEDEDEDEDGDEIEVAAADVDRVEGDEETN